MANRHHLNGKNNSLRFIDLFAGLGGFHLALSSLGHTCVFASELDPALSEIYEINHGIKPHGDIREVKLKDIPSHDILCAGFPCQPFSKAGEQLGFNCPQSGDLFQYVINCLKYHKPTYILLENVPNILKHKKGKTWKKIETELSLCGYDIKTLIASPHMVGVPQIRERVIVVGKKKSLNDFQWPKRSYDKDSLSIHSILDKNPKSAKLLPPHLINYIEAWQKLLSSLPYEVELPSFPLWAMEFGATYPYEDRAPLSYHLRTLQKYKGSFGRSFRSKNLAEIIDELPPYALDEDYFPDWKVQFIKQNRAFYCSNKKIIDSWLPNIKSFPPSFQKLEWNWKGGDKDLWQTIIQFRASGIRAKKPTVAPALVALTTSQIPIIAWEKRYMTLRECAKLQSMESLKLLPEGSKGYKALGNAVNVKVIKEIASELISSETIDFMSIKRKNLYRNEFLKKRKVG